MRIGYFFALSLAIGATNLPGATLIYTFTGSLQATYAAGSVNGCVKLVVNAETSAITNPSAGKYQVAATSANLTAGTQNTALTGISVYLNQATGQVTVGSTANGGGGIAFTNDALKTWNLSSPIGPFNGTDFLQQGTGTLTVTAVDSSGNQTVVTLTGTSNTNGNGCNAAATFQAALPSPIISSIANAAGNVPFNSPIAQGAIFVIKGSGLGPSNISISPTPFQTTTLSNTSIAVTVGSTTVNALMYYTSDGQLAALLPSNTPAGGQGSFTVSYNGQTSAPVTHGIASSNVGVFTIDSSGGGPGIVTFADYSLVSAVKSTPCGGPNTTCGAANPGDTLILWATGLGPVGDDASGAGLGKNMPNVPLTLYIGGVQAPVTYQGRSGCCIGEDQIVFTIPNNVPLGCAVPLVVQIGTTANTVSNTTTIPIAKGSRDCTPTDPLIPSADFGGATTLNIGQLDLFKAISMGGGLVDQATPGFFKASIKPSSTPFFASYVDATPPGLCTVTPALDAGTDAPATVLTPLDAGASFTLKSPAGSSVALGNGTTTTLSASGSFLTAGTVTFSGPGGKDVGPFSGSVTVPSNPTLTSPAVSPNLSVTRSSGMTFTWKGGDPGTNVQIIINSALDNTFTTGSTAACIVPTSAGSFTIPAYTMLALPAGNFANFSFGAARSGSLFTATGLNLGTIRTQSILINGPVSLK